MIGLCRRRVCLRRVHYPPSDGFAIRDMKMKQHFDELLPFYVNNTLTAADRSWVEDYLRQHPKSLAEMQWYQS